MPIAVVRGRGGELRAFYNVCKHRAHELLVGSGTTGAIVCPYHAWTYGLDGQLKAARRTETMDTFDTRDVCLDRVQVEEFGGMVYVNLDPTAPPLREQAGDLAVEIAHWAPDVDELTHARRLTFDVASNWKNVIDNFLECYHCHVAHEEFVDLVDMDTYEVRTHGIWSSHFAEAGKHENAAYDVSGASVSEHAVWWLWPNTCLLRYPGRGNFMVFQVLPAGPERTLRPGTSSSTPPSSGAPRSTRCGPSTRCSRSSTSPSSRASSAGCGRPRSTRGASCTTRPARGCPSTACTTSTGWSSTPTVRWPGRRHPRCARPAPAVAASA